MTPASILREAAADGVNLVLSPSGTIMAKGDQAAVSRWIPVIRQHKPQIIEVLREAANDLLPETRHDILEFFQLGDPANDDAAMQERVAIMIGGGMDATTALREARWGADRERCWRCWLITRH